jgi:uncharacterized protein YneR
MRKKMGGTETGLSELGFSYAFSEMLAKWRAKQYMSSTSLYCHVVFLSENIDLWYFLIERITIFYPRQVVLYPFVYFVEYVVLLKFMI